MDPGTDRAGIEERRWEGATHPQRFRSLVSEAVGGVGCARSQQVEGEGREEPLLSSPSH